MKGQKNIKGLLVMACIKQVDIARAQKVSRAIVSEVVSGRKKSARIRRAIARALKVRVSDLWPEKTERKVA